MAIEQPETQYVQSGDIFIAYQEVGDRPRDLVFVPGFVSNIELAWEITQSAHFFERLASFSRLIIFDKRGTGLSDRPMTPTKLEDHMDDLKAVLDAVDSKRCVLFGISEGGPMSILFAATYPERASELILYGTTAKGTKSDDYPWALTQEQHKKWQENIAKEWGNPHLLNLFSPSMVDDKEFAQFWARSLRHGSNPRAVMALLDMLRQVDVRDVLPSIRIPTLVLHRKDDRLFRIGGGRYLAEHIPGATLIELEGADHTYFTGNSDALLDRIEEFVTGERPRVEPDRVLATVLFTDIVDSTKQAEKMGDAKWRELLKQHNNLAEEEIRHYRGKLIKSTGDGILATFDGPSRGIGCAKAMGEGVKALGIEVRAGLHTGEVELLMDDIGGVAVHIASRVIGKAGAGEIVVSSTVKDLVVGSGIEFEDLGRQRLKGISDEWRLFRVQWG